MRKNVVVNRERVDTCGESDRKRVIRESKKKKKCKLSTRKAQRVSEKRAGGRTKKPRRNECSKCRLRHCGCAQRTTIAFWDKSHCMNDVPSAEPLADQGRKLLKHRT